MPVPTKENMNRRMADAFFGSDQYLKLLKEESGSVLEVLKKYPSSVIHTFLTCMLERLEAGVLSIDVLYSSYLGDSRLQFGLGILLRALHLDYLIMLNIVEILDRNKTDATILSQELDHFCLTMLSDGAKHTLKLFKENNIHPDMRKKLYSSLVKGHEECFESYNHDGSEPVLKINKTYSPKELVNRLKKSASSHLADKGHHYAFYSKYDHFGKLFHSISKEDFTYEFIHLSEAIRELPRSFGIMINLAYLITQDSELQKTIAIVNNHCDHITSMERRDRKEAYTD